MPPSWNIQNIFFCHVKLIYNMVKYSTPCHRIFFHVTYMIVGGIINDLLTLNILSLFGATNAPNI
jgi:hypothetical protein